jgi:ribosomal-protein-alanine N-acetyltransferase
MTRRRGAGWQSASNPLAVVRSKFDTRGAFSVRDASVADLPQIMAIENIAFEHPWSEDAFLREFALPFSRTIVALQNKYSTAIIGYLCRWLVTDECHILNVAVDPHFRRAGVGSMLMSEAIAEEAMRKAAIITLEVRRSNLAARGLYRKMAFEERRLRKNYYGVGEDAIVMERRLAPG